MNILKIVFIYSLLFISKIRLSRGRRQGVCLQIDLSVRFPTLNCSVSASLRTCCTTHPSLYGSWSLRTGWPCGPLQGDCQPCSNVWVSDVKSRTGVGLASLEPPPPVPSHLLSAMRRNCFKFALCLEGDVSVCLGVSSSYCPQASFIEVLLKPWVGSPPFTPQALWCPDGTSGHTPLRMDRNGQISRVRHGERFVRSLIIITVSKL